MNPTRHTAVAESPTPAKGARWAAAIALGGILLALATGALATHPRFRAQLAETNFQANMIRLGDYRYGRRPEAVLIGTSLSGRLLPSYFAEAGLDVANLGLDGAMAVTAMEVAFARPDPAPVWLVETRTLGREPGPNDTQLLAALDDFSFRLGGRIRALRASARPSSMLYTRLKLDRDRRTGGRIPPASPREPDPVSSDNQVPNAPVLDPRTEAVLERARAKGVRVVLVHLPDGQRVADSVSPAPLRALATERGWGLIDVPALMAGAGLEASYTDGLHLAAPAAAQAARLIAEKLRHHASDPVE